ncbi:MAG: hypothetical protein IJI14_18715 [Anaerolineaceae bacterium]|nr:hypothetical protein [Anaerolineaceae bacterium]
MELLSPEKWAAQQSAGTWSELFDRSSLINSSQILTVVIWLAAFWLLGLIFMPLTAVIFRPLKDRGWGISKFFGLMVWGYAVWLASSLGMDYSRRTILLILGCFVILNGCIAVLHRRKIRSFLKSIRKDILRADMVFLICFLFFLFIRFMNPDLWHPYKGGERPMDFSYFNAILKSTSFPPYDPWFAGGFLNYYYYGIYLSGLMVKLLGVVPAVAFNLNLALWYAFLGSAAFCIGKTLFFHAEKGISEKRADLAGLFSVIGMQLIGNLGTVVQIKNELVELGRAGNEALPGWSAFCSGVMKLFSGERLMMYKGDWYWIPSRAIPDTSITEFPFFSFLYGDPHAHLFALPMTVLVLVWLTAVILRFQSGKRFSRMEWILSFFAGPLLIGILIPTNTWDAPTYFCITAAVLIFLCVRYGIFSSRGKSSAARFGTALLLILLIGAVSIGLVYPYLSTNTQENKLGPWHETRTPIASYLMHWGVFLFFITVWYCCEIYQWMKYTSVRSWRDTFGLYKGWFLAGSAAALLILLYMAADGVPIIWIALPLMVASLLLLLRQNISEIKRFVFFLVGVALFATILVEMIHLVYDVGRMNTVFKFYNQVWVMLSLCAAFGLSCTLRCIRTEALEGWPVRIFSTMGILLTFGAFLYTLFAGVDKMTDRMSERAPHTLDGMKYMESSSYWQDGFYMDLSEDYQAILWLQENVSGSPVIVEASPTEYKFGSRYTVYTGLPGVVGWNYHQRQQRGPLSSEVWNRVNGIHEFYNTTDVDTAVDFLKKYNVQYIIVGQMEKGMYSTDGIEKFAAQDGILWDHVYEHGNTKIYKMRNENSEVRN